MGNADSRDAICIILTLLKKYHPSLFVIEFVIKKRGHTIMNQTPIRFAITGAGYIAEIHAQAIQAIDGATLTALVARDTERTQRFAEKFQLSQVYRTVEELISAHSADAVIICTPNALHAPQALTALKAGLHVMLEKPMGMDAEESHLIFETAKQSVGQLMVAHCWRFDEEVNWLKDQVNEGRLGQMIRTKGYGVHANWGPSGWFSQSQLAGGGALADMGIHAIDTARYLLGDPMPISVYAKIGTHYGNYDVDDTGIIIINWEGGCTSYIESGWWQPHMDGPEASTQLYGTRGFGEVFPTRLKLCGEGGSVENRDGGFTHPREIQCPQIMYNRQLAELVQCIYEGRRPTPGAAEGLVNMQIVDAAYRSSQSGQVELIK